MNKLIMVIVAVLALSSPVYGQKANRDSVINTCEGIGNLASPITGARDSGASMEAVKTIFKEEYEGMTPLRLKHALVNNINELVGAIYSSSCSGDDCLAKFFSKGYDECMDAFKERAESLGLEW